MNKKSETIRFIKYATVGICNTVITFLTFTLLRAFSIDENWANAWGYVAGMINSFIWNRQWVFQSQEGNRIYQVIWFCIGAGVCWILQWIVFRILLGQEINESLAYLIGMGVYTILNYLFNKIVTFRKRD